MSQITIIADRYEIGDEIGQGGMGTVYKGRDQQTGQPVAIKALKTEEIAADPTILERFRRESEALRRLNHPNIVKILDEVDEYERHFIIMEYIGGGSLAQLLARESPLPIHRVLEIALDLADALTRAHRLKIIHRDLKPQNILLTEDGTPRLTDFGVAQMHDLARVTRTGMIVGTIPYLSPEICQGAEWDERTDLWAFGVVIYEMLTGMRPFDGLNTAATINAILTLPPAPVFARRGDTPKRLSLLVDQMLAKDPEDRISSVRAVGTELEAIMRDLASKNGEQALELPEISITIGESRFDGDTVTDPISTSRPDTSQGPRTDAQPTTKMDSEPRARMARHAGEVRVFLSYRRDDSGNIAARVAERLGKTFGEENVLKDIDRLALKTVSRLVLARETAGDSDAMVVLIGPRWLNQLDNPKDTVRQELEAGLKQPGVVVVPVLVNGGTMPKAETLPPALQVIAQTPPLTVAENHFESDMRRVIARVQTGLGLPGGFRARLPMIAGVAVAVLITLAFLLLGPLVLNSTPAATPTPDAPVVQPVAPGEYMVLVADLEPVNTTPRDVSRFIADDLRQQFEVAIPFSKLRVRRWTQPITSAEGARAAAETTGAPVVLWGNYSADFIEVNVHAGSLAAFPKIQIDRAPLERTANLRLRLTDERSESLAIPVLGVLSVLHGADGNGYGLIRTLAIADALDVNAVPISGSTVADHLHRVVLTYIDSPENALEEINSAIALDGTNPILFMYRASLQTFRGDLDSALRDVQSAERLGPQDWAMPPYLSANIAFFQGDLDTTINHYNRIIELRPEDWFVYNYRGALYYLAQDYELARADYDQAIALEPDASFPYSFSTVIALRQGRIADAQNLVSESLSRFPDPSFVNRIVRAAFGAESRSIFAPTISAFTNQSLGQYDAVVRDTETALTIMPDLADMYLLQGFAYCNLRDYPAAEAAYDQAIERSPDFALLYILRAEVRREQGNLLGAAADITQARSLNITEEIDALIDDASQNSASCETFFTTTPQTES